MQRFVNFISDAWDSILKILAFILLWLAPISNYIHLVLILIFIDLLTGSYAAVKEGQKFSARKLRCTIEKFVFYAMAIIAAFLLQQIINDGNELSRIVALYIGATELKSIYENISRITKTDILSLLWDTLKQKIESYIQALKNKNNDPKP
jgi:phage-related holin